jgi:hypothetical protein
MKVRKSIVGTIWFIFAASVPEDATNNTDRLQYQAIEQGFFPNKLHSPIRIRPPPAFSAVKLLDSTKIYFQLRTNRP